MNFAFFIHAVTNTGFSHQAGETCFQHTGANTPEDVFAGAPLEYDAADADSMQQLREQQPRRATADNAYLGTHATDDRLQFICTDTRLSHS